MWKARIIVSILVLFTALGPLQSAQDAPTASENASAKRHVVMLGLVRTINTIEVGELTQYGSYAPWPVLLAHHSEQLNTWLKKFYLSGESNAHFDDAAEVLPEWNLRLNVRSDGKGYVLLLSDSTDKTGFGWVSDESGLIRQCKALQ